MDLNPKILEQNNNNICRACLSICDNLESIFQEHKIEKERFAISFMISTITSLEISLEDNLPNLICKSCTNETISSFKFRRQCLNADHILKSKVKTQFVKEKILAHNKNSTNKIPNEYSKAPKLNVKTETLIVTNSFKLSEEFIKNKSSIDNTRDNLKNKFTCKICFRISKNLQAFKSHSETHLETYNYLCNSCGKKFKTKVLYRNHIKSHDPNNKLKCKICDKISTCKSQYDMHMRIHSNEKPFRCEVCGKGSSQKSSLKVHMRIHTGEKPHRCKICNKQFNSASTLAIHIRQHTGEKPYKCNVCEKRFSKLSNLKVHYRTHTGEKPYICDICNKGFVQRHCLKSHLTTCHAKVKDKKNISLSFAGIE